MSHLLCFVLLIWGTSPVRNSHQQMSSNILMTGHQRPVRSMTRIQRLTPHCMDTDTSVCPSRRNDSY